MLRGCVRMRSSGLFGCCSLWLRGYVSSVIIMIVVVVGGVVVTVIVFWC